MGYIAETLNQWFTGLMISFNSLYGIHNTEQSNQSNSNNFQFPLWDTRNSNI